MKLAVIAFLLPVAASAQAVRAGPDAYGDWHADQPGVTRHLSADDLPRPEATPSVSRGPSVARRPPGAMPAVPPGFDVQIWATGLDMPRTLRTAPDGRVFLAESGAGRVLAWQPIPGEGHPPAPSVFASGLEQPFGLAFWPPDRPRFVYVAETSRIVRYPYDGGLFAAGPCEVVVPALPQGGHWTRDLAVSPDGSELFVSVGSASNVAVGMRGRPSPGTAAEAGAGTGAEAGRAAVFAFKPDGGSLRLVASGLRNCVALAIQPATSRLWCATNERDGLGDDLPPDYVTHIEPGAFYGWPWFYIGGNPDPRHSGERPDLASRVSVPDVLVQPHSAPLGMVFYQGTLFPPEYRGDALVTLHGSWNRARRTGYKVVRVRMRDGQPVGDYQDFMTGMVIDDSKVWARPVGITVLHDGSVLVSEDGNGTIWRVGRQGPR